MVALHAITLLMSLSELSLHRWVCYSVCLCFLSELSVRTYQGAIE